MIRQTVRNEVVLEVLHIVLWARLRACARVTRDTKDSGLTTDELKQRRNAELSSSGVATRVCDACSVRNLGAINQLR